MSVEQPDPYKSPVELGANTGKRAVSPLVILLIVGGGLAMVAGGAAFFMTSRVEEFGDLRRGPVEEYVIEDAISSGSPSEVQP